MTSIPLVEAEAIETDKSEPTKARDNIFIGNPFPGVKVLDKIIPKFEVIVN